MIQSLRWALAVAAVLALSGTGSGAARVAESVTVQLTPQNNSGESGTATLTEEGTKTRVAVAVTGAPAGVAQPLHVHKGTCAQLDPRPAYGLAALTGGKSETTIDVSLAALQAGGFAVNGHKSAADVSTYVFCGAIPGPH
jgi:Cu/Zn superoxide dismutase